MTITPERREVVDFSAPYFSQWVVAAVRPDSTARSLDDLKGKKVAVMKGSSQLEILKTLNLNPQVQLTDFALQNYNAVIEGDADFTLMNSRSAVGERVGSAYSGLKVAMRISEINIGVAVRKGSDLRGPLDLYLEGLRKSGELEKIRAKHGRPEASPKTPRVKT